MRVPTASVNDTRVIDLLSTTYAAWKYGCQIDPDELKEIEQIVKDAQEGEL